MASRATPQNGHSIASARTWRAQEGHGCRALIGRTYHAVPPYDGGPARGRVAVHDAHPRGHTHTPTVRLILAALVASSCASARPPAAAPTRYTARVVRRIPHATDAFTQGLAFHGSLLYESTGLRGRSSVRVIDPATGAILRRRDVSDDHFAEGLTVLGGRVFQLTYQTHTCFVYDAATLDLLTTHTYPGEGWGLTHDGRSLILSDGTDTLRLLDPDTFAERRRVRVTDAGSPVDQLNELEWMDGALLANVWHSDRIARIDLASGHVVAWIDLPFSRTSLGLTEPEAVLNGIAYDPATRRLLVTGKLWPAMFEIALSPAAP